MITVETMKETAAAAEPPELPPHWFLYLVERMDRMENNLRSEFRQGIGDVRRELHGIYRWSIGLLVTMLLGFGGIVVTLAVTLR